MTSVDLSTLRQFLLQASYKVNGDSYEQKFGALLSSHFPNCEKFWKLFIVPLTERIEGYPSSLSTNIRFRLEMNAKLEDIASTHYSMFMNLVYAYAHSGIPIISSFEDFFVHLGSVCDLVEAFLEKSYLLLLSCRNQQCKVLQNLSRDEFLAMAAVWYDNNYSTLYAHYLSKGKTAPLRLPSRKNIVHEFLKEYLRQEQLSNAYYRHSQSIREFRNVIVHDIRVGKLEINGQKFMPKPTVIQKYKAWRQVFAAAGDEKILSSDFVEQTKQLQNELIGLVSILNQIWEAILREYDLEFYQANRMILRDMYKISIL